jgi:UPF0716 family protein affecting phage T7 exclusion
LGLSFAATLVFALAQPGGLAGYLLLAITGIVVFATAIVGRALFYVLVIHTTMPGAFFWRNKGFQEHAREVGLAGMPQVGVIAESH